MMNFEEPASFYIIAVYSCILPPGCNDSLLARKTIGAAPQKFGLIVPHVTNEIKVDAVVAFENSNDAVWAINCIEIIRFSEHSHSVSMVDFKDSQIMNPETVSLDSDPFESGLDFGAESVMTQDHGRDCAGELEEEDYEKCAGSITALIGSRERVGMDCKSWQQEGDWPCPNLSCSNINFSFRGICNRCGTARPAGSAVAIGAVMGCGRSRGRGRGSGDIGCRNGRGSGGPPGLFGPNDWNCPMCGNVNWAKRTKCNICNTTKPGYNEGGVREGRAGGYKEFDEAEIEETKRRRREMEEDDGEMYDEFGYLKKKFRAKAKAGDLHVTTGMASGGMGKAGWDMEELGVLDQPNEKNKDHSGIRYDDIDSKRGGRSCFQNVPSAQSSQRAPESGRDVHRGVDEWSIREDHKNIGRDRDLFSIENQGRVHSEAWPWEKNSAKDRGETECVVDSKSDQQVEWLRGGKRIRERDRILD